MIKNILFAASLLISAEWALANSAQELQLAQVLAEQGQAQAQFMLAQFYQEGMGIEQSTEQAFQWYQKAAEQGLAAAQFSLASAYDVGEGVKQDLAQAAFWYEKAARQGDADAAYNLGIMFDDGAGVKMDKLQASVWLRFAALLDQELAEQAWQQTSLLLNPASKTLVEQRAIELINALQQ